MPISQQLMKTSATTRIAAFLAALIAMVGLTVATSTQASAQTVAPNAGCQRTVYGYRGVVKCGSAISTVWPGGQKETFAIAPNRAIYHVWPGSGGWKVMPGAGRADEAVQVGFYDSGRVRYDEVCVKGVGFYISEYHLGTGRGWRGWSLYSRGAFC